MIIFLLIPLLRWFWVEQVLKLSNLTTWLNNQNHVWVVKFRPETEKNEHAFIWWDFHAGSRRNVFQSILRSISWDLDEHVCLQSRVNELVSWSLMKEKFWSFVEKWFELRKQVKMDEKFKFSYLEKFSHSKNLDGMENIEKLKLNPLFSRKSQVKSHS